MRYKCPKCGSEHLRVKIEVFATLVQGADDNIETDIVSQDHEWGENSPMNCINCDHDDIASEFEVTT